MNQTVVRTAIYAATAAGVFWLPFHVTPSTPVYSVSQAFHFNNQVALVALLAGLALATWWSWREPTAVTSDASRPPLDDRPLGWWPLLIALAISGVQLTLISAASAWLPMDNAAYFIYKLFAVQAGQIPYRDFEFAYGPAMLYIPVALRRVTGLSVDAAYLASLWIFAWGGLFLLWWIVRQARTSWRHKTMAFLLLAAYPALNPEFGLSYTLTRYICGFAALVAARTAAEKLAGRWFLVALCHLLLSVAVLAISWEIGLAFLAALAVYWLLEYRAGSKWLAITAAVHLGILACLAILVWRIAPRDIFLATLPFDGGGSLPLFPSPYVLLYLGSLLLAIAPLLADTVRAIFGKEQRFRVFGTLTGAFAVQSVAMIPAALNRPDPEHVLYNGIGVFLLTLLAPWIASTRTIRKEDRIVSLRLIYQVAFFLIFPVLSIAMGSGYMLPGLKYLATLRVVEWSEEHQENLLARGVEQTLGPEEWQRLRANLQSFQHRSLENLFPDLKQYGKICDPVGAVEIYPVLGRHDALQPEYYFALSEDTPATQVRRKVEDAHSCTYAILPRQALLGMPPTLPLDQNYYSQALMFPVWGPPTIPLPAPQGQFFKYAKASFVPLRQVTPGMYLCKKRLNAP
jgi:Ca2+/Na+ antiporter